MATQHPSEGTIIQIEDSGSPGSYLSLAQVVNITPPGVTTASVDRTHLLSLAKESRPSLIPDHGEVTFTIQYDPNDANHQLLRNLVDTPDGTNENWKITYNTGNLVTDANDTFAGHVTGFEQQEVAEESDLMADITIKISGKVTRNAGADV